MSLSLFLLSILFKFKKGIYYLVYITIHILFLQYCNDIVINLWLVKYIDDDN